MKRQLDLAAIGDAALEGIGALENAADIALIFGADRLHHLAVDDIMREVGAEPHLRDGVEEEQSREEVVGNRVAMRLELNRELLFVGDREPRPDRLSHIRDGERHDLSDNDDEGRADVLGETKRRTQLLDRARKRGQQALQACASKLRDKLSRRVDIHRAEIDRHAVEARRADRIEPLRSRSLWRARPAHLGRPQGLIDTQRHRLHACLALRTRGATG